MALKALTKVSLHTLRYTEKIEAVRILLADDHGLFRDSLSIWLESADPKMEILPASSLADVLDLLHTEHFDLVLLDLGMPDMRGASSVKSIVNKLDNVPVIVVSADDSPLAVRACLASGAAGYVPKSSNGEEILRSIRRVMNGLSYVPEGILPDGRSGKPEFSEKQLQILALLAEGTSNKKIAERMFLSEGTVKQYVSAILRELDVDNRTQAGIKAREVLNAHRS